MQHRGVALARRLRRSQTRSEAIVWSWLRARRFEGWKFRRQHPIGPYIADFYSHELRLAIEIDGRSHGTSGAMAHDARRNRYFEHLGIAVLRIAAVDVITKRDDVAETLRVTLTRRFAAPSPGGRG